MLAIIRRARARGPAGRPAGALAPVLLALTLALAVLPLVALAAGGPAAPGTLPGHPQTSLTPESDFASWIYSLFLEVTWWEIGIFVVVEGLLLVAIFRFRARPGGPATVRGAHGHTLLEFAWTLAPAIVLAFIAVPTVRLNFRTQADAAPGGVQVHVIGHQWWWEFQYPQYGIVTANELHLPLGRTASFTLESADVIHSFWLPALGGKRDVVPGRINHLWFTPEHTGEFPGQCAEFCGASHANMRMRAFVETPAAFDAWVRQQTAPPAARAALPAAAAQGADVFAKGACIACHTVQGVSAGTVGPNLTHVGSRTTIAGATLDNTPANMARWLADPPAAKPGAIMPNLNLSSGQIQALTAYLGSLK